MKQTVRIGIVGTGFARAVQIPAFLNCANAEIVSVASASLKNAESTAKQFNIKHFTDDWRETVDLEAVNLICITTPPNLHFEQAVRAIENGKHVLCEKPMAMSVAEARTMTEKAGEKNLLALIDYELRFQAGRQKAFEIIRNGDIGKIIHAKYNFRAPHRGDPSIAWNWWSDERAGGGALGAIGSHAIDSFQWLAGAEISQIFCQLQTHVKQRTDAHGETRRVTSDDEANFIVRFADGDLTEDATGVVSLSVVERPKYQNRVEIFGTNGAIRVEHRGEVFLGKPGTDDWTPFSDDIGETIDGAPDTGFSRGFTSFAPLIVEAIRNGATDIEHAATFEDGLKVQTIMDAARESNEKGCVVKI